MSLAPGTVVRVRDAWPEANGPVHIRTPHYVRGLHGTIVSELGIFPNPEDIAFERPAPAIKLYHVGFRLSDIWPDAGGDDLLVEIYEHWLEQGER